MTSLVVMWALAAVLGFCVYRRGPGVARNAARAGGQQLLVILPRVCFALLTAGFVGKLMPSEAIGQTIGFDSGASGVLIAALAGGMLPSGPIISFPIIVVLKNAGAGLPQILAFLTAWSVFAFHRVLAWEVTTMGWQFASVRLFSSLILPFVAAAITYSICMATGLR